ncbi:type II secretion system F family protein [Miltoncostaea marina]|uniref:type II secretion system F family protein n=1 Tax=Miltoncostaea marina TaxID=2843215 RepID=UPI001C3C6BF5|nr:type II secretion system F family protein [Miltoncostaea marina]
MSPAVAPLSLWLAALALAAVGLRGRAAGRARRPAAPRAVRAGLVTTAAAVPCPCAVARALARPGDEVLLLRAGLAGRLDGGALARARAVAAAAGALAGTALALASPVLLVAAPALALTGALAPGRRVRALAAARRRAVVRELPDLLDLLGICVGAGMALDPALELTAGRLGGTLGDEIRRVLGDLAFGTPRAAAYRALTERVDAPELARTVAALLQAEELGAPLSRALEGQAAALRAARRQDARERAARAAPKIQLVVAMLMVPAILLLVIGVLIIELARQVGGVVG